MSTGLFTHDSCYRHITGSMSPESPNRIRAIEERLVASGLEGAFTHKQTHRQAQMVDLLRAHEADYIEHVRSSIPTEDGKLIHISEDTVVSSESWTAALESAGCVLEALDCVHQGQLTNAFCCVRPPGHHARRASAGGFCILNNVAIAALYARDVLKIERIAVVDIDAHHGDGTEDILAGQKAISFFSFFEKDIFPYPALESMAGNIHKSVLSAGDTGERACEIIRCEWEPLLRQLNPQIIFISAGFDAHRSDTMTGLEFSDLDYAHITRIIDDIARNVCDEKIVSVLEGGYEPRSLSRAVIAHIRTLAHV